ncbi:MAG: ABC transporter ATP-binding protein [Pseudomonadales bacterium]
MIIVENLSYTYPKTEKPAVTGINFSVSPGEIFGLLGPSGAGKSTTQRVLTRQNRRYSGNVTILSQSLQSWGQDFYEKVGVSFELPNHYLKLTGKENLEFFASLYKSPTRDPNELLELVSLSDAADVRVEDYSKGMKMRLNFVRALLHDPDVLFFDEPTSGLDPVNAAVIKQLIREQREAGKTVLLTTHNMHDVEELCNKVGFIVAGRMVELSEVEALKARFGRRMVTVEHESDGRVAQAEFDMDGLGQNDEFLKLLNSTNVRTIHSQEASLDRVFADVTGVSLYAEEG